MFTLTPCRELSVYIISYMVSAYKLMYFAVYLELFLVALRSDTVAFVRMLSDTHTGCCSEGSLSFGVIVLWSILVVRK